MKRRTFRSHVSTVSAILALGLLAPSVLAQPKSGPAGSPAGPSKDEIAKATAAFGQATKFFQQKKFGLALDQFKLSYSTVPSPNSHLYIARCQAEMGDLKEAFRTFQKVVVEANQRAATEAKYAPTRDSAKTELDDLSNKIGVITVNVVPTDPAARLKLGGALVPKEDWGKEMPVDPGPVVLTLEVPNQEPFVKKVDVIKGQKQTVSLDPASAKPVVVAPPPVLPPQTASSKPPFLPIAIAAGAVGVVGMGMFGVAGAMSSSTYSKLKTECGGARACADHTHDSEISKGRTQQTIANVGLGVGAVGLAASAGFFIAAAVTKDKKVDDNPRTGLVVVPAIGPGYAGVHGSF